MVSGETKAWTVLVSSPLDDLCIDIWISAMIISAFRYQRDRGQQCTRTLLGLGSGLGDMSRSGIPFVKCVTLIALGPGEYICVCDCI